MSGESQKQLAADMGVSYAVLNDIVIVVLPGERKRRIFVLAKWS